MFLIKSAFLLINFKSRHQDSMVKTISDVADTNSMPESHNQHIDHIGIYSGSIAISVAAVIEPMPLICSATWALPSKWANHRLAQSAVIFSCVLCDAR